VVQVAGAAVSVVALVALVAEARVGNLTDVATSPVTSGGSATPPVIDMRTITKRYLMGGADESSAVVVHALRGVDVRIERGEFVAIMGASGSGKSTLMNIIGALDAPTSGSYRLDGLDVSKLDRQQLAKARNRMIGFVFQSFNLIPRTTAAENVELPLVYAKVPIAERKRRVIAALAAVGLSDRADHLPSELSGGQQQRVAIARAIVTSPALLLADEPTGALDTETTEEVLDLFGKINALGRTVVLITHEHEVAARAQRSITLRDGSVLSDVRRTAPHQALSSPSHGWSRPTPSRPTL
jgi:putative ABC transport system ATP-binding protein